MSQIGWLRARHPHPLRPAGSTANPLAHPPVITRLSVERRPVATSACYRILAMPTRRRFCLSAAATLLAQPTHAQFPGVSAGQSRLNLAVIDHDRILAAAAQALARPVAATADPASDAFLQFTLDIPALAAAHLLAEDPRYPAAAAQHLQAWLATPATRLPTTLPDLETVLLYAPLAELAVALPFLQLPPETLALLTPWFAETLTWLTESRTGLLARDNKDDIASAWLLLVAAFARLSKSDAPTAKTAHADAAPTPTQSRPDAALSEALHRFKTSTIRTQINANGLFPNELPTPNPFRNSLLNLDLLAGACVLLSTRFDSLWDHELQDGPGMRSAISRHAPYIASPHTWPYPADKSHFHELPCRRPALLFAARAYSQPDYATIWRALTPAQPTSPELLHAFPIRQPILWQSQPKFPS